MKRPFSPLVWLCAAGAVALSALALLDPNGVYADYIAALDRGTPAMAAVFTAAQEGVYPWSTAPADDLSPRSPAYHALTETVTDDEMRSSVGNNEPFPEAQSGDADSAPDMITPSVEIVMPAADPAEQDSESAPLFVTVDKEWFNDALFIGDSHIEGFSDYAGLRNATYYYKRGLDIYSVMKKSFVGGKLTIPQALSQQHFGKIYIMLGINEIGYGSTEGFAAQYADVIAQLRELQPDAVIYILSIFHTTQKKSDSSPYNNDTINARNAAIAAIADGERVFYLNCNAVFDDENGALTPAYTGDGVHVKAPYYTMWRDYLFQFGRAGVETTETPVAPLPAVEEPAPAPTTVPVAPTAPAVPETPVEPAVPVTPAVPETPAAPEAPAVPETPAAPETPVAPVTPAVPEGSAPQSESESIAEPAPAEGEPAQASQTEPEAADSVPEAAPDAPETGAEQGAESAADAADEKNIESEQKNA